MVEEECALPDTHAQSLAQIEDLARHSGTTIVKLGDAESQSQENVMTYTTIIKSKHVRHATYVSKECLESIEQVERMKEDSEICPEEKDSLSSELEKFGNNSLQKQKNEDKNVISDALLTKTEKPSEFSYASALVMGKAKPMEPVKEEPKKPY